MTKAIYYKALKNKFQIRKSNLNFEESVVQLTDAELVSAEAYIQKLISNQINYTYWGDKLYPQSFLKMKNPPLFFEYIGHPCWTSYKYIAVVGSRSIHSLTVQWLESELEQFLHSHSSVGVVSGGAMGVDLKAHLSCIKYHRPTIVVLPSGLHQLYPKELDRLRKHIVETGGCLISEYDLSQNIHKAYFFQRNRLIAALGEMCLVPQCKIKSGTFLTVHHALENGRPVVTVPSHPYMNEFSGNRLLMNDGAEVVDDAASLGQFWNSELWSRSSFL